jgi:hypothetical protein
MFQLVSIPEVLGMAPVLRAPSIIRTVSRRRCYRELVFPLGKACPLLKAQQTLSPEAPGALRHRGRSRRRRPLGSACRNCCLSLTRGGPRSRVSEQADSLSGGRICVVLRAERRHAPSRPRIRMISTPGARGCSLPRIAFISSRVTGMIITRYEDSVGRVMPWGEIALRRCAHLRSP